jgi:hypothetical protein
MHINQAVSSCWRFSVNAVTTATRWHVPAAVQGCNQATPPATQICQSRCCSWQQPFGGGVWPPRPVPPPPWRCYGLHTGACSPQHCTQHHPDQTLDPPPTCPDRQAAKRLTKTTAAAGSITCYSTVIGLAQMLTCTRRDSQGWVVPADLHMQCPWHQCMIHHHHWHTHVPW